MDSAVLFTDVIEMKTKLPIAAASNGKAAVAVIEFAGSIACLKFAPSDIGHWDKKDEFNVLFERAAGKLGWKRDRRCSGGWRKVGK